MIDSYLSTKVVVKGEKRASSQVRHKKLEALSNDVNMHYKNKIQELKLAQENYRPIIQGAAPLRAKST